MTTPLQANLTAFAARVAGNVLTANDQALLAAALAILIPAWPTPDQQAAVANGDEQLAQDWLAPLWAIALGLGGGGGGATNMLVGTYSNLAAGVSLNDAVYVSGLDTVARAQADSLATHGPCIGFVSQILTPTSCVVCLGGELGGFAGMFVDTQQYLDPATPGGHTAVAPTTAGQFVQTLGIAKDASTIIVLPGPVVQL